ncbi:MAG: hypothetical protein HY913_16680 [Desulfomonile tiedjei]|nr:hypothetical protein [Desulfomonile tiedjei]
MSFILKHSAGVVICLGTLLFAACVSMSTRPQGSIDKRLLDTWELLYQENDKGDQERPNEATRTLIEFTDRGQVIFNRMDKDSDKMKKRSGRYSAENEEISITDDGAGGNTVRWPYQVAGDTLVLQMPEVKKKFYWRRYKN